MILPDELGGKLRKRRRSRQEKLKVLYCDDDARYIDAFRARHADNFDVEVQSSISGVYRDISGRRDRELPDVLLLDLYHPTSQVTADALVTREAAKAKLEALSAMIREVREHVDRAWTPSAISVLEELRAEYPEYKLPVMIYTQRGLLMLTDAEIRRIEDADADWLLKDPERISDATEAAWIRRYVRVANAERHLPRDMRLTIGSVVASTALGVTVTLLVT